MPSSPPFPVRPAGVISPLITAGEGYPAMEQLVREAKHRIWMSFRVFDPLTPLVSGEEPGGTWLDLLRQKLREGVEVRVLLSDFDPVGGEALHLMTWTAVSHLMQLESAGDFQVLPLRHEARAGRGIRIGFWLAILREIGAFRQELNELDETPRTDRFAHWPGLWRHLRLRRDRTIGWRAPRLPRIYPVTVHQKILIADDQRAVIGGLDIDERRWDDHAHDRPADRTWHDVSMQVEGRVAGDIAQHLADTWNDNRLRIDAYFRELSRMKPDVAVLPPARPRRISPPSGLADSIEDEGIQLLRTVSRNVRRKIFGMAPRTEINEIEDAHLELIRTAKDWIYLETQFFRSRAVAEALATAAHQNPALSLVVILPAAPEEIAFERRTGIGERFGEYLQVECVDSVKQAFGNRAVFLSPARPVSYQGKDRAGLHDAEIIYVHSKVAIADGKTAIVGSANLNGRSLRWDTEAAVQFNTAQDVQTLTHRLVRKWWRIPQDSNNPLLKPHAAEWAEAAEKTAARSPEQRESFLVPYDPVPAREFGFAVPGLPEELV